MLSSLPAAFSRYGQVPASASASASAAAPAAALAPMEDGPMSLQRSAWLAKVQQQCESVLQEMLPGERARLMEERDTKEPDRHALYAKEKEESEQFTEHWENIERDLEYTSAWPSFLLSSASDGMDGKRSASASASASAAEPQPKRTCPICGRKQSKEEMTLRTTAHCMYPRPSSFVSQVEASAASAASSAAAAEPAPPKPRHPRTITPSIRVTYVEAGTAAAAHSEPYRGVEIGSVCNGECLSFVRESLESWVTRKPSLALVLDDIRKKPNAKWQAIRGYHHQPSAARACPTASIASYYRSRSRSRGVGGGGGGRSSVSRSRSHSQSQSNPNVPQSVAPSVPLPPPPPPSPVPLLERELDVPIVPSVPSALSSSAASSASVCL